MENIDKNTVANIAEETPTNGNINIKKKKKKKKRGILTHIMGGHIFLSDWFTKNALLLVLIVVYSFVYVSNRYEYERELLKISRLTKTRDKLRNNLLTLQSEFSYKSRQTEVEKMLNEKESNLKSPTKPVYLIKKED